MITLHIEVDGLVTADYRESDRASQIHKLFGSYRVPTAWTFDGVRGVEEFGARVITTIRTLNPGENVEWGSERCEEFVAFRFARECRAVGQ